MGSVSAIQQAFEIANQAGLTREELDELENQLMYIQDQKGAITYAVRVAEEKAKETGREEGREEGVQATKRSIAQALLTTLDDATISQMTGLSVEAVRLLRSPL